MGRRRLGVIVACLLLTACARQPAALPLPLHYTAPVSAPTPGPSAGPTADPSLADVRRAGTLVVCQVDGALPMSSRDSGVRGYEVEIARQLAADLGVQLRQYWTAWDDLVPSLLDRHCDAVVDRFSINLHWQAYIAFSTPYYEWGQSVYVRAGATGMHAFADVAKRRIGAVKDSFAVEYLTTLGIGVAQTYPDELAALRAVDRGQLDAVLVDSVSGPWTARQHPELHVRLLPGLAPNSGFAVAVGLRWDETTLRDAIDQSLVRLQRQGAIAQALAAYGLPDVRPP